MIRPSGVDAHPPIPEPYRLLFEKNPNPMWVFDRRSFAFVAVNEAAVRHYGYSADEFLAMTAKEIRPPDAVRALVESVTARSGQGIVDAGTWRHQIGRASCRERV